MYTYYGRYTHTHTFGSVFATKLADNSDFRRKYYDWTAAAAGSRGRRCGDRRGGTRRRARGSTLVWNNKNREKKTPNAHVSSNRRKRFGFVNDGSRRRAHNNNGPRLNKSNGRNSRKTVQFFFSAPNLSGVFSLCVSRNIVYHSSSASARTMYGSRLYGLCYTGLLKRAFANRRIHTA